MQESLLKYDPPVAGAGAPDKGASGQGQEFLNSIFPPLEFERDGQAFRQQVSAGTSTRVDVIKLQELLDRMLAVRQAREQGICPVREELYNQCFDELIRQVTLGCAERGFLLLRVRDELRMRIAAYQTLYDSSIAFGLRKALQAEQGKTETDEKINKLLAEKKELEKLVGELKVKCDTNEKRESERRSLEEKRHAEEIQFLKRTNDQLKAQLFNVLQPKKDK